MSRPIERHADMGQADMGQAGAESMLQQMTNGYWATQIIYTAAKLQIADQLRDGPRGIEPLAEATGTHTPSLYRLMRALAGLGVFRETANREYEMTALGRCLVSGSPGGLRARAILNGEEWYRAWGGLLQSVRTGANAFERDIGMSFFDYTRRNAEYAAVFNEAMVSSTERAARAVVNAYDFSAYKTVVDVGGGTGAFLAGILQANPHASGVLFDRPEVVSAAEPLLTAAAVAGRCDVAPGDFFDEVPSGGDVYILSWIIHDWDDDRSIAILRNCRRAMTREARLLVVEQVVPPGNEASLSKLYDIHMLMLTGGRERTEDEYRDLLSAADLQLTTIIPTDGPRSVIEALPQ